MKKIIAIILISLLLFITASTLNGCHETTKNFGGTMTIELESGCVVEAWEPYPEPYQGGE